MLNRQHTLINLLILFVGLAVCQSALGGKPVKVNSANPPEAEQNTSGLAVTISGSGFDTSPGAVTAVNFLLPCATESCSDSGGVAVTGFSVSSSSEIVATINVAPEAAVEYRDIEVQMTRGRGGKGTTLFKVWSSDGCDRDGDGWSRDNASCDSSGYAGIDCDDQDPDVQACAPPGGSGTFTEVNIRVGFFDPATADLLEDASPWVKDATSHEFGDGWINWDNNTLTDDDLPRPCRVLQVQMNGEGAGRYDCFEDASNGSQWPHGGQVSIPISGMQWQQSPPPRRGWKNPELCDELLFQFDDLTFGATRYQVLFTDGCTDASCPMHVSMSSYSGASGDSGVVQLHDFHDLAGYPDIGRIKIFAIVDQDSIVFPPTSSDELNVFAAPQELEIEQIQVSFESVKSGALVAICETAPGAVSGLEFWTWPEPYSPPQ